MSLHKIGYLFLNNMQAHNVNFAVTPHLTGYSMTSFAGFIHALQRDLNQAGVEVVLKEFFPVIHDNQTSAAGSSQRLVKAMKGDGGLDKPHGLTTKRTNGLLVFSMVIAVYAPTVESDNPFDDIEQGDAMDNAVWQQHAALVERKRLNGGSIRMPTGASQFIPLHDAKGLKKAFQGMRNGFCIQERYDLLQAYDDDERDGLDALLHALALNPDLDESGQPLGRNGKVREKESEPVKRSRAQLGWVVPLSIGFISLEQPAQGRIKGYPHVYAEPAISLAEFVGFKRLVNKAIADNTDWNAAIPFWDYCIAPEQGEYLIRNI